MNWYKLAQSIEEEFPIVTLYHGSLASNLERILKEGIRPKSVDAVSMVNQAVQEIVHELRMNLEQVRKEESYIDEIIQQSQRRLGESKFEKVYLSSEFEYAESNATAGGEWYEMLVFAFMRIKYDEYEKIRADYSHRQLQMYDQLKKLDEMISTGYSKSTIDRNLHKQRQQLEEAIRKLEMDFRLQYDNIRQQQIQEKQDLVNSRFGEKAVVFTVKMPYQVFRGKIASPHSMQRLKDFEATYQRYKEGEKPIDSMFGDDKGSVAKNWFDTVRKGEYDNIWDWFHEVHLSFVEPQFIVDYKVLD